MPADNVLLRQLKVSFVLQLVGAGLFAIATVIRFIIDGLDVTTFLFLGATVLIGVAAVFTRGRIQQFTRQT